MLDFLYVIYAFIFGSIFASFSSAIAWRTGNHPHKKEKDDKKYSIISGRSICPNCEHTLPWWTLVPIFSYLYLRGKCFNCKKNISILYPLMEILCGLYFSLMVLNYLRNNINIYNLILFVFVFFVLIILSFQDVWFKEISDTIALPSIGIVFGLQILFIFLNNNFDNFLMLVISTIIVLFIFGSIVAFTGAMGGGDLRAFALISLVLMPLNLVYAFTLAFVTASFSGIVFVIFHKKVSIKKYHVRLIPFLALGFALISIWSNIITTFIYK